MQLGLEIKFVHQKRWWWWWWWWSITPASPQWNSFTDDCVCVCALSLPLDIYIYIVVNWSWSRVHSPPYTSLLVIWSSLYSISLSMLLKFIFFLFSIVGICGINFRSSLDKLKFVFFIIFISYSFNVECVCESGINSAHWLILVLCKMFNHARIEWAIPLPLLYFIIIVKMISSS